MYKWSPSELLRTKCQCLRERLSVISTFSKEQVFVSYHWKFVSRNKYRRYWWCYKENWYWVQPDGQRSSKIESFWGLHEGGKNIIIQYPVHVLLIHNYFVYRTLRMSNIGTVYNYQNLKNIMPNWKLKMKNYKSRDQFINKKWLVILIIILIASTYSNCLMVYCATSPL